MSIQEVAIIAQTIAFVVFYAITGLGFGVALGLMIGNQLGARGQETLMQKHTDNMKKAGEHNAQWSPKHQRWQK